MLDKDDDFELYIDIAHNCHNAVPIDVLDDKVFKIFTIKKEKYQMMYLYININ